MILGVLIWIAYVALIPWLYIGWAAIELKLHNKPER